MNNYSQSGGVYTTPVNRKMNVIWKVITCERIHCVLQPVDIQCLSSQSERMKSWFGMDIPNLSSQSERAITLFTGLVYTTAGYPGKKVDVVRLERRIISRISSRCIKRLMPVRTKTCLFRLILFRKDETWYLPLCPYTFPFVISVCAFDWSYLCRYLSQQITFWLEFRFSAHKAHLDHFAQCLWIRDGSNRRQLLLLAAQIRFIRQKINLLILQLVYLLGFRQLHIVQLLLPRKPRNTSKKAKTPAPQARHPYNFARCLWICDSS